MNDDQLSELHVIEHVHIFRNELLFGLHALRPGARALACTVGRRGSTGEGRFDSGSGRVAGCCVGAHARNKRLPRPA